ncbi:MAG: O-antigen ligase [Aeromicrobium erythreum]
MIIGSWLVVATLARLIGRSWWAPGPLLALVMSVSAVGTRVFAPEYYMSLSANFALQMFVVAALVGGVVGENAVGGTRSRGDFALSNIRGLTYTGYFSALLGLFATLASLGVGPGVLFSPARLIGVAQAATYQRYTQGIELPIYVNLANAVTIAFGMLAAAHWVSVKKVSWAMVGPLIIYGATNMLITTRAPILMILLAMVFSAVFADRAVRGRQEFRGMFSGRVLIFIVLGGGLIAMVFFYFQTLRFGAGSTRSSGEVWAHLRRYPWGSLPGFSLWFDGLIPPAAPQPPGFYTLMGLYDNLGIARRVTGSYSEYYQLTGDEPGNIYTAFRGLLHDFGWIGALSFTFSAAFAGGMASSGRALPPAVSLSVYVGVSAFFAFSFVISYVSFTANIAALLLAPVLFRIFTAREQSAKLESELKK